MAKAVSKAPKSKKPRQLSWKAKARKAEVDKYKTLVKSIRADRKKLTFIKRSLGYGKKRRKT